MVVDFHTHIFKNDVIESREKYFGDKNYYFLYSGEKARMINHNMMLDSMNDSGIDFAVAMGFPWYEEKHCDEQNEYFNDVYDLSKGRIIPFGSVPIRNGIDIDRYVKGIKESGLFGIGEIAFYKEGMNQRDRKSVV